MTKILYGDSECFREGENWLQETSSDIFSSRWFFLFSFWKSRSCKLIPNLTRKCMITYKNKYFGQNPWSYKMFFCYVNWTKCHSLRWYGTLNYGGFHEKFNFLKIQARFKTLEHLSKTFWNDLAKFSSRWVWNLRKVHGGKSSFT